MTGLLKKLAVGVALSTAALFSDAKAANISFEQLNPHHYSDFWEASSYIQNNTNDVLNEAKVDYSDLLGQVANLDHNISAYSNDNNDSNNLSDFITGAKNDKLLGAGIGPIGNMDFGWDAEIENDGKVYINNNGILPGVTYDRWTDQRTMEVDLQLSDSLLNGYDLALDKNRIIDNMADAQRTPMNIYPADGYATNVVPEPATIGLLAAGLVGLIVTRKKQ